MNTFCLAAYTLWKREIVRFFRQRSRVIGALGPPLLFWFLIGSGFGHSFADRNYLQYFFPGTLCLIVLFTAIFSTISLIEDRHQGFLQSVLVAPLSGVTLVVGKLLGGTTLATGQAILCLLIAPLAGVQVPLSSLPSIFLGLAVLSFGLTGLGFILAWWLDSTQGFHAVMNLFLMPMWLLSGAVFPGDGAVGWTRALMKVNPLSYGLSFLQQHLWVAGSPVSSGIATASTSFLVSLAFALATFAASVWMVRRR